jgi:hypothetical protein
MSDQTLDGQPADQFWDTAVAAVAADALDPARRVRFTISRADKVATAGSCFTEHLGPYLQRSGFHHLVTEAPLSPAEPVFSARYGAIQTVRQLHQLMLAAYGLHRPATRVWRRKDGRFIDPLRPRLFPAGFATEDDVAQARHTHLAAVRRAFQECNVFVFTLGNTEAWLAPDDTALPAPPDAVGALPPEGGTQFHNYTAAEMRQDMDQFLVDLFAVNKDLRVLLTVSPAGLAETGEPRHVLVSNSYSKAALRVVADEAVAAFAQVDYFPGHEIITAPQAGARYFEADLRTVSAAGMDHVMRVFSRHMLEA